MAPIRTAIIGLSASGASATSWASNAHLPYLLSPRGQSKYKIVALCNSSVDAARKAIQHFNLPPDTKAYGDPQAVADDADIELVVVATRVDVHYQTALPSAKAGKHVYVEWPLAQDVEHVDDLVQAAKDGGGRTVVGLQGRVSPPVLKLRDLLKEGRIGKVLSSEVRAAGGSIDRNTLPESLKYFTPKGIGGNVFTIGFGHYFAKIKPHTQIQRPEVKISSSVSKEIIETVKTNVPDLVIAVGTVTPSETVQENASVLFRFRQGQPFGNEPALVWTINGTKGELRLTAQAGTTLHAAAYFGSVIIEHHDFATDRVEDIPWAWEDWQEGLPVLARIVGLVYERFAEKVVSGVPTFDDAQKRHKQLEEIIEN
ncbi:unnamed protein product [Clonostachys rosea f. rosea IK726]|uniref:Uncharacterized protein n=2 Tax=Bionectria ochroleuca TaxID=29856 RepID=A0A0B7KRT3_BIOOC|nr:unnamed protein product [Clonostachys rosea f. rosea IK726]